MKISFTMELWFFPLTHVSIHGFGARLCQCHKGIVALTGAVRFIRSQSRKRRALMDTILKVTGMVGFQKILQGRIMAWV